MVHIPTALGAVVVDLLTRRASTDLNLDADNVAGIFLGDDQEVERSGDRREQPRRRRCPTRTSSSSTALTVVGHDERVHDLPRHRQPRLAPTKVGKGKEVNWPTGHWRLGNDGVAGGVKQTDGAAGCYVELNCTRARPQLTSAKR